MKTARLALLAGFALAAAFAQAPQNYTYEYPSLLNPYTSSQWTSNGTNSVATNMYTSSASTGGSLIFSPAIAAPSNCYEVHFKLNLASPSGNYMVYLRASSNALYKSGSTATGTFYAVEITNISNAHGLLHRHTELCQKCEWDSNHSRFRRFLSQRPRRRRCNGYPNRHDPGQRLGRVRKQRFLEFSL